MAEQLWVKSRSGPIHLYVDLSGCASISPAGVDLLVDLRRRLAVCGGRVILVWPPVAVRRLLSAVQTASRGR